MKMEKCLLNLERLSVTPANLSQPRAVDSGLQWMEDHLFQRMPHRLLSYWFEN